MFCPVVSLFCRLPLAFSAHAIDTNGDEGEREYLTHIEGHTAFKVYLDVLGIFDKESECEDEREAKSEEETRTHTLRVLAIERKTHEEEHEIGDGLIQLPRMARHLIHPFEDKRPRHIGYFADDFRVHEVA